jgi:D-alanyl-lipoteichoic acid acyltransferase DltB (MBOAT superfamily)
LVGLIVPLGISFHTFQQIALLIDVKNREVKLPPLLNYVFFVLFFPQLIAGPIVLHQEMGKQVGAIRSGTGRGLEWLAPGLLIFIFGLFKKICLADNIASYADVAFAHSQTLMMPEAWAGAIAYMLQLFFDFSGYSDMAVGIGLMFGFKLPNNFLVPLASTSIAQFWQRWHITMFRFFTTYLYHPLWLNQRRRLKRWIKRPSLALETFFAISLPTLVTFFLSGLWHGAGWTFIFFGMVHGCAMVVQQTWKSFRFPSPPKILGWVLTMVVVLVAAVYFRSNSLSQAHTILHQMFVPSQPLSVPAWLAPMLPFDLPVGQFTLFANSKDTAQLLILTALLGCFSLVVPVPAANPEALMPSRAKAVAYAGAMASMTWLVLEFIGEPKAFLYFAF